MKTKIKKVYYCEFCRKYRLTKPSMELHEKHCTLNPNRECGVCGEKSKPKIEKYIVSLKKAYSEMLAHEEIKKEGSFIIPSIDKEFVDKFENKVKEVISKIDCPACTLSCLRLAGSKDWEFGNPFYDYKKEVEKYWENKRGGENK